MSPPPAVLTIFAFTVALVLSCLVIVDEGVRAWYQRKRTQKTARPDGGTRPQSEPHDPNE